MSAEYDAVVIGSGPGGYEAALTIVRLDGSAVVVEKDKIGGVCTNYGCIPTKALVSSVEILEKIRNSAGFGINVKDYQIDFSAMQKRKDRIVGIMSKGVEKLLHDAGVEIIKDLAEILDQNTVKLTYSNQRLKTKNIIIATGSRPFVLPNIKLDSNVLTSDGMLELRQITKSMLVIGAGFIGLEWGSILASLGTKITIVERLSGILPLEDREISTLLQQCLEKKGIEFILEAEVKEMKSSGGSVTVVLEGKEGKKEISVEKVLVAVGRKPNVQENWQKLGLNYSIKGIKVNAQMRTNLPNIYAIGDVTGKVMLAHAASRQGIVAAENIMGKFSQMDYKAVPNVIFTIPQVASVGLSEQEAQKQKIAYKVGRKYFLENGKARAMGEREGLIKVLADSENRIIGSAMLGDSVTDLIAEAGLAVQNNLAVEEIKNTIHAHPTLGEIFKDACADIETG